MGVRKSGKSDRPRLTAPVALGLPFLLLLATCGGQAAPAEESLQSVRGAVTEVEAGTIIDLTSLTVVDGEGRTWSFRAKGFVEMTPSHLRQHALLGDPVTVYYRVTDNGTLVAVRVED